MEARPGVVKRFFLAMLAALLALTALVPQAFAQEVTSPPPLNEPPPSGREIIAFPQRDFVSAAGYTDTVTVEVIHPDGTKFSSGPIVPQDDPTTTEFDGIVEVNHPGGGCWLGTTPDIRPGDKVRITSTVTGAADQTTVANVTAKRPVQTAPGTVVVHGTAQDAQGNPLPLDQIEQRLVAAGDLFEKSGKRTLRAAAPGSDGTLAYDAAPGSTSWTATYTGLSDADVTRALEAESRAMWLGANPLAGTEATIYEIGAGVVGGPQAPCNAPKEVVPPPPGSDQEAPTAPTGLETTVSNNSTVTLNWTAASDNVGVTSYGVYRNGVAIANVQNPDGSAPAPTTYVDKNVPPGDYVYTVDAADEIGNRSAGQSNEASATTTAQPAANVAVNDPPVGKEIVAFPSRDFVEVAGFGEGEQANIEIIRNGNVISTASGAIPQDDPTTTAFDGVVEVNHPGGVCWEGVTPELRTGDIVRATAYVTAQDGSLTVASVDQTTVANVTAGGPVQTAADTIEVHGTAQAANGDPLPLDQIEQRLITSSRDRFGLNDRRAILAPGDGTISYDTTDNPTGVKWTATYTGLTPEDMDRALNRAESRVLWLGRAPLAGNELTIFEFNSADPPGPAAGFCSTPLEPADTAAPSAPTLDGAAQSGADVQLAWSPTTDDNYVYGYRVYKDGQPLKNVGRDVTTFTDKNVVPGEHNYAVTAIDSASPRGAGPTIIEQLTSGFGQPYGNESDKTAPQSTKTVTVSDVSAPSVPGDLTARATTSNTVELSWSASRDDAGVAGYGVYRRPADDPLAPWTKVSDGDVNGTSYTDATVEANGAYEYTVDAADAAGNRSEKAPSQMVNVVLDLEAPAIPGGVVADNSPDIHGKDVKVSWNAANDNVGTTGYGVYRRPAGDALADWTKVAQVNGSTLSYTDTSVAAGTYSYAVDANDSAGNRSAKSEASTVVVANNPPAGGHSIIAFPQRDFVEVGGLTAEDGPATVSVIRDGRTVSKTEPLTPVGGIVEVNHAGGGGCWTGNTPDIRPGDVVRVVNAKGVADQITVSNITAGRPIQTAEDTVVIKGTAADAAGNPIDLDQIEQRLISGGNNFAINGRRALLAPGDGTISYDAPNSTKWTATYKGLSAADVTRALGAESRILWLGRAPLVGNELTIFENGAGGAQVTGGPATPDCTAPLEPGAPLASASPNNLSFGDQSALPASTSAPRTVTLSNSGTSEVKVSDMYLAGANPGDFAVSPNATIPTTLAPGTNLSVEVTFSPKAVGARSASLNLQTSAANQADFSVGLSGNGINTAAPSTPGAPVQSLTPLSQVLVNNTLANSALPVTLNWAKSTTGTVTHYQLQRSINGGAFTDVSPQPASATSTTLNLAMGTTTAPNRYQFQVRACNGTDCSAWSAGPRFTVLPVDESDLRRIAYNGNWTLDRNVAGAYGGTVRHASTAKDKAQFNKISFTVNGNFAWISTFGPNRGRASVSIDGGAPVTVDLYSSTQKSAQVAFARNNLSPGEHQVVIQVLGTRNAASTGTRVDIDAMVAIF